MNFNPFVIPFCLGAIFLIGYLSYKYIGWIIRFQREERRLMWKAIFSLKMFEFVGEVFSESLIHRKIFKANILLGLMHSSLAFGWFLLIVMGTFESKLHSNFSFNAPYDPIFFQFFIHTNSGFAYAELMTFIMDLLLAIILTGVLLAWFKRFRSRVFGMKKATTQRPFDRIALTSLWLIFPLRFVAESITAGIYHNGGFLTNSGGQMFASFLPLQTLELPAWWAYSLFLGIFFVALPFSRYMHIPTEVFLIFLRRAGIKSSTKNIVFQEVETHSCPRCGLCIDQCQLNSHLNQSNQLPVYYLAALRHQTVDNKATENCLLCGKCQDICPVSIQTIHQRISNRVANTNFIPSNYEKMKPVTLVENTKVAYFAGCMGHLNPKVSKSMISIFKKSQVDFSFIDQDGSVCCGKTLEIAGDSTGAASLRTINTETIKKGGFKELVTSCPICYHQFKNEYALNIPIYHHTEYISMLINDKKIIPNKKNIKVTYHDPCELGRLSGQYEQSRHAISLFSTLIETENNREKAPCCGGSLGNLNISAYDRDKLAKEALKSLLHPQSEAIITACPLCKKTFSKHSSVPVMDISELIENQQKEFSIR